MKNVLKESKNEEKRPFRGQMMKAYISAVTKMMEKNSRALRSYFVEKLQAYMTDNVK